MNPWSLAVTSASTQRVCERAPLKDYLRVPQDITDEDALIDSIQMAAQRRLEERWGRSIFKQVYQYTLDEFPTHSTDAIKLPKTPLVSVSSITVYDTSNNATVWSSSEYRVDTASEPGRVVCNDGYDYPTDDLRTQGAVVIAFTAGYTSSQSGVPDGIVTAVKALTARMYEHRGDEEVDLGATCRVFDDEYLLPEVY